MAGEKHKTPIERAKARVKRRDAMHRAMHEDHVSTPNFASWSDEELIALVENPKRLRREELAELDAVWFTRFGEWLCEPADASAQPAEPEPTEPGAESEMTANDTMTRRDVARKLRIHVSSVQRMERDGRLPKAGRIGARGRRHLVRDVDAFIENMDQQRHAPRNRR